MDSKDSTINSSTENTRTKPNRRNNLTRICKSTASNKDDVNGNRGAKVAIISKVFYHDDSLEEKAKYLSCHKKKARNVYGSPEDATQIHEKASPFIKLLQEAEKEKSLDEDSDVKIEYDDRAKADSLRKEHPKTDLKKKTAKHMEHEEDVGLVT